jgi:hypothetical protein
MNKEDALQIACIEWLSWQYPNLLALHIPNGGGRHPLEAKKLKRMGVRAGVPDIFIPELHLFCELKIKPNKPTELQQKMLCALECIGYKTKVIYSVDEFQEYVKSSYLGVHKKE